MKEHERMRVAVVGSGAVGGYYGARLARAGHEVHFLMRSDLEHVRHHGLVIESTRGDFTLPEAHCAGRTEEIGPCDLVLIAIKATSNEALISLIPPLLDDSTILLTLQNGLGNEEFLAGHFGENRILGGLAFTCINRTAPGHIVHLGQGRISLGEFRGSPVERTLLLRDFFLEAEIDCEAKDDLLRERWKKLVWNVPFNGLSIAEGGIDVGKLLHSPGGEEKARELMREIIEAARAFGHDLPDRLIDQQIDVTLTMGDYRPSSLIDYLEGREVEVEAIWGEPLRRAAAAGVDMPLLGKLYEQLRALCANQP